MRRLCQKVRHQQDASWIDLRCFILVQLALHLAANSARVSAGNSVVLVCQIHTQDTSSPFRAMITFQDSDYSQKRTAMTTWRAWELPLRSVVHVTQCHFSSSKHRRYYLQNVKAMWSLLWQIPPTPTVTAQGMWKRTSLLTPFSIHSGTSYLWNYIFLFKPADVLKAPPVVSCLKKAAQVGIFWRKVKMNLESRGQWKMSNLNDTILTSNLGI